ncbi:hypothetical protein SNE40_008392 [Patella caerulea]|uniref:Ubiquitin-like domain-containing protein n=1 Tax=Patella caerulea TaxID=87958 RepID=A0AAN8K008_PATCE
MMSDDTSLQQVVTHQSLNFHLPCNVQIGEHNIQNQLTNQLQEDNDRMKEQIQQLKLDKQGQADEIQKLKSRVRVVGDKTRVKKTYKNINKEKGDMITLTVKGLGGDVNISVSRDKPVKQVEEMIQEKYRRKCGRDDVDLYIISIHSIKQDKDVYRFNNQKDLPLSYYGVETGDKVWL